MREFIKLELFTVISPSFCIVMNLAPEVADDNMCLSTVKVMLFKIKFPLFLIIASVLV